MSEKPENPSAPEDMQTAFIRAATWHDTLDEAHSMLALYPELASLSIFPVAILGIPQLVRDFLLRIHRMQPMLRNLLAVMRWFISACLNI